MRTVAHRPAAAGEFVHTERVLAERSRGGDVEVAAARQVLA